jgi:hypothetical protein
MIQHEIEMSNTKCIFSATLLSIVALLFATSASAQYVEDIYAGDCPNGLCIPNPANFGYYQTGWRRWPTSRPASPPVDPYDSRMNDSLPAVELPDPRYEGDVTPPVRGGTEPPTLRPELPLPEAILPQPPDSSYYRQRGAPRSVTQQQFGVAQNDSHLQKTTPRPQVEPPSRRFGASVKMHPPTQLKPMQIDERSNSDLAYYQPQTVVARSNTSHHRNTIEQPAERVANQQLPASVKLVGHEQSDVKPQTSEPVEWKNPFRTDDGRSNADRRVATKVTLPLLTQDATPPTAPTASLVEPRRIDLPGDVTPLPREGRVRQPHESLIGTHSTRDAIRSTPAGDIFPAGHLSGAATNPLRSAGEGSNPLRRSRFEDVAFERDDSEDREFRNPLRSTPQR